MDFRAILDSQKMTSFQWAVVAMTTLMNFIDGFDVLSMAFTASNIQADMALSKIELGYLFSSALIGMTCGSMFLASLADKYGRRPILLLFLASSALAMIASAFALSFPLLLALRFITGLGVGAVLVVATSITGEFANKKYKALAISIYTAGFTLGATFAGMISGYLQTHFSWHSVFFAGGTIALISVIILFFFLPESIDFLVAKKPQSKQLDIVAQKLSLPQSSLVSKQECDEEITHTHRFAIVEVLNKKYRVSTLSIWCTFFIAMFCFYVVTPWTPVILKDAGMTGPQSIIVGYMITFGGVLGCLVYGLIATAIQPRILLLGIIASAMICIVGFVYSTSLMALIIFGVLIGFFLNAIISGSYSIMPTIYRTDIRNAGVGYTVGVGRIGAISAPITAGFLLQFGLDKHSLYLILIPALIIGIIGVLKIRNTD